MARISIALIGMRARICANLCGAMAGGEDAYTNVFMAFSLSANGGYLAIGIPKDELLNSRPPILYTSNHDWILISSFFDDSASENWKNLNFRIPNY